jgi:plastocyanin
MLKKLLPLLVVLALIIGGVVWATANNDEDKSTTTNPPTPTPQTQTQPTPQPSATENSNDTNATNNQVSIANMAFSPTSLTVKKGTQVTWTNNDSVTHTVTADTPSDHAPDSGNIAPGDTFTFTFDDEGTFAYHCEPHPQMEGTITVTE